MSIGTRLKALREAAKLTQTQMGNIAGTTKQYVSQLEKGVNQTPNGVFLEAWSRYFSVTLQWITTGNGPKSQASRTQDEDWADVRAFAQFAGAGHGTEPQEYAETHALKFKTSSLRKKGLLGRNLSVYYVQGDSMLPRISDGDAILFDEDETGPVDGAIFVVSWRGEVYVKRIEIVDDLVLVKSDNPLGDHAWSRAKRMDNPSDPVQILGRVRWIGSWEG